MEVATGVLIDLDDDIVFVTEWSSSNTSPIIDLCTPNKQLPIKRTSRIPKPIASVQSNPTYVEKVQTPKIPDPEPVPQIPCGICLDNAVQNMPYSLVCGHIFCKFCITKSLTMSNRCPKCRRVLNKTTDVHRLYL